MKRFMLIILAVSTVLVSGVSCSKEDPQQKLPEGALPGEFSISAAKKVHFSQGNLVATIDASGVPVAWKFATKQHDYLGECGANGTIGTAAGDVDLFCWSTDATSNNWGIYTMTEITEGVTDGNFNDWGKNIGNGNVWRTLSTEEWQYLFSYDGSEHGGVDYDNDTNLYKVVDYFIPKDGNRYEQSLKEIFTPSVRRQIEDFDMSNEIKKLIFKIEEAKNSYYGRH